MTEPTTEVTEQLRALGQAVEERTAATTPQQQVLNAPPSIDVDSASLSRSEPTRDRPRRLVPLIAAAALVIAAIGGYALFLRADPAENLELAAAAQPVDPRGPEEDNGWQQLRQCESKGDYTADAGNSFYGAYQFTSDTWRETADRVGLDSVAVVSPAAATPALQDALAAALYDQEGADAWPVCGRYLTGPMITPLVPQWVAERPAAAGIVDEVLVFLNPDVTPGQIEGVGQYLKAMLGGNYDQSVTFVDQPTAYAEFQEMFADQEQLRNSVGVADMPPSYRVASGLSPMIIDTIEDLAGVFEVVYAEPFVQTERPRKLTINGLAIETPLFLTPAAMDLSRGVGTTVETERGLVVIGYGSFEGAVFADIATMQHGDTVQITELVNTLDGHHELVYTYEVITPPETVGVDELPLISEARELVGLTLVADVADDPSMRTVVQLLLAAPDRASYGLADS